MLQKCTKNLVLILCAYKPKLFEQSQTLWNGLYGKFAQILLLGFQTIGQESSFLRLSHCSTMDRKSCTQDILFYSLEPDDLEGSLKSKKLYRWEHFASEYLSVFPELLFQIHSRINILLSSYGLAHCRGKSCLWSLNSAMNPSYPKWCVQGWNPHSFIASPMVCASGE